MKRRITKSAWEALDEAIQALYKKAEGSDNYTLDIEDDDDSGSELKKAKDREKKRADKAEQALTKLQEDFDNFKAEQEEKTGDGSLDKAGVDKLKADHKKALDAKDAALLAKDAVISDVMIGREARRIAEEISTMPDLMETEIAKRMKLEYEDGKPVVRILNAEGEIWEDKKFEDLSADFVANEKFAPIIIGSRASGGGAAGNKGGGGASKKKLSEMSATEEAEFANKHPEKYEQMLADEK